MRTYLISLIIIFFIILVKPAHSQHQTPNEKKKTISGRILDDNNEPLPFVNIYIEGSTYGTTSNYDGDFDIIIDGQTPVILVFQFVGFKKNKIEIPVGSNPSPLIIELKSEQIQLGEVVISANREDPAYPIIRKAIELRKYNRDKVKSYSVKMYMKTVFSIDKMPDKKSPLFANVKPGIDYLTESVSTCYFKQPNYKKEIIIASRVAKSKTEPTENIADFVMCNFYDNLISLGMSARSFVSPIAGDALFYYRYRLIETFEDNQELIHKIQVIPKRESDNIFKGYIYIAEKKFDIHSLSLTITRQSQIDLVDSIYFKQVYVPVNDSVRMPLSLQRNIFIAALGVKGSANSIGHFSEYKINIEFPEKFFNNETLLAEQACMEKDAKFWDLNRQSVLTDRESREYHYQDSLISIRESKEYRDSVNVVRNKFKIGKLPMNGYYYRDTYKKRYYNFYPLVKSFSTYNTVEGFNINIHQRYLKIFEKNNRLYFHQYLKYSFTNNNIYFNSDAQYYTDWKNKQYIRLQGGIDAVDYNELTLLNPLVNTAYTLLLKDNFSKLYQKEYLKFSFETKLVDGFNFSTSLEYANRLPLVNHTDFTIFRQKSTKEFTSNNPQDKLNDAPAFEKHQALIFNADLVIKFKERYETFPTYTETMGTTYPIIKLSYKKGIQALGSDVDFDHWNIGVFDKLNMKNLGFSNVSVELGGFFNVSKIYFMDFQHFNGNQSILLPLDNLQKEIDIYDEPKFVSKEIPVTFQALDYYSHSTNTGYFSIKFEHHFNGWIINKLPLLRKSKAQVVAGMNYLHITDKSINDYTEFYAGLEHILKMLRIDFVTKYQKGQKIVPEIRIGLGM